MRPDLGSSGRKGPHTLPKEPARITPWVGAAGQSPSFDPPADCCVDATLSGSVASMTHLQSPLTSAKR
jgi:hypothetical protein